MGGAQPQANLLLGKAGNTNFKRKNEADSNPKNEFQWTLVQSKAWNKPKSKKKDFKVTLGGHLHQAK